MDALDETRHQDPRHAADAAEGLAGDPGSEGRAGVRLHTTTLFVIPGRASWREPGIHFSAMMALRWIPGSR